MIANSKQTTEITQGPAPPTSELDTNGVVAMPLSPSDPVSESTEQPVRCVTAGLSDQLDALLDASRRQEKQLSELVHRDALFASLHERLAAYEQNERQQSFVEPLARKVAPIHRRLVEQMVQMNRALESLPKPLRQHSTYHWAHGALDCTRAELETVLADFGIEPFTCPGVRFDRTSQEAVERIATRDPNKAGTIARRVAPGFRVGERIVIAERVAVFVVRTTTPSS